MVTLPVDVAAPPSHRASWLDGPIAFVSLREIMDLFDAEKTFAIGSTLRLITHSHVVLAKDEKLGLLALDASRAFFDSVGANIAVRKIDSILSDFDNMDAKAFHAAIDELHQIVIFELQSIVFFRLSANEVNFYQQSRRGWEEVIDRFPDSVSDIEEANKCFALSRYAASVFHSTQILEIGVLALGRFMGVSDPASGFTAVTNHLDKLLKKHRQDLTQHELDNRPFFEQIHGTIAALKNAWRNKISHAQGRAILLTADFTPEIAEEILMASRAFMRRLATELPSVKGEDDADEND